MKETVIAVMPGKTNRERHKYLTDLDYADDVTLTSTLLKDAQDLLTSVENTSAKVCLFLNARKTEYKYLGSMKDFMIHTGQAWAACNRPQPIWQSNTLRSTKLASFRACVESIRLYGLETWTMKKALQDWVDGRYTRLLTRVQNISWREHKTKAES